MTKQHNIFWFVLLLGGVCVSGCEQDTRISIDGNNPPKFKLRGSGKVYFIRVYKDPVPESEMSKNEGGIWQINPDEKMRSTSVSGYPEITYGEVPSGFIQKIPNTGAIPPRLETGQKYILFAPTYNANFEILVFMIKDGKSVKIPSHPPATKLLCNYSGGLSGRR